MQEREGRRDVSARVLRSRRGITRLLLCAAAMVVLVCAAAGPAAAAFTAATANGTNSLRADILAPPTAPGVNQTCVTGPMPAQRSPGGSSFTSGTKTGTVTVARPTGAQVGDVMLASISWFGDATITDGSGLWTPVYSPQLKNSTVAQSVYYRVVTATEPASYTWNGPSIEAGAGGIVAYSGVDTVAPVNATSGQVATDKVAPSVTTTRANVRLVGLWAVVGTQTPTVPSGMTQIWNGVSNGGAAAMSQVTSVGADEPWPTAGATGTRTLTSPGGHSISQLVALQPPRLPHATMTWTRSTSGYDTGQVYRRSSAGTVQRTQTLAATATSQADGPLISGTAYTVDVAATFAGWTSTRAAVPFTAITC